VALKVEAVSERLKHTYSCGHHEQPNIKVTRENEFAADVRLHLTGTKEVADALCIARRQVRGIQRMHTAMDSCS
jgi:hypothetical protein